MKTQEGSVLSSPALAGRECSWCSRWLCALLVLLGGFLSPALAQTRDVITFTGGQADPRDPNIYIIDAGTQTNDDENIPEVTLTLSRPQGASATHKASITLNNIMHWDEEGTTITFEPGETTKTVTMVLDAYANSCGGNIPTLLGVLRTNYAEAGYQLLVINTNFIATEVPEQSTYASNLELLREYPYAFLDTYTFRFGEYVGFKFGLNAACRITADSRLVLTVHYTDHTGLALDADDYGMSKTREVVLTPVNAGSVCDEAWYIYQPKDDEYMYSYHDDDNEARTVDNRLNTESTDKVVNYQTTEVGPFEVVNPASDALKTFFFSRADLNDDFNFGLLLQPKHFLPTFSNVNINKTTFKSGETMVITATMDNWHLVKRARQESFMSSFGVSLDGSVEPRRFDFDEQTGTVTCYATAPTVTTNSTVQVDFGPLIVVPVMDDQGFLDHTVRQIASGSEGFFTVTVSPTQATAVPATSIDFVDLPADGSSIELHQDFYDNIEERVFPLAISSVPANATDGGTVTYSVENVAGPGASIVDDSGDATLSSGKYAGTIILTATLESGVSTQRTYNLTTKPSRVIHTSNTYLAGTTLPKFQFEISGWDQLQRSWDWTAVDDDVTVNYTHANGSTWTEHYSYSRLSSSIKPDNYYWSTKGSGGISKMFDLPFVFTTEHPDATLDQIGQPIVTAEVLLTMENSSGNRIQVVSTASLEPILKYLSFQGYTRLREHYHMKSDPVLTSAVMYLPTQGFSVGYEIPELGMSGTYNNQTDGENVPEWLELQEDVDGLYTTAKIKVHPNLDKSQSYDLTFYTLAQRTCLPDEVMERNITYNVNYSPISATGNMVYRVNAQDVTGDLTFDNSAAIEAVTNKLKSDGFVSISDANNYAMLQDVFNQTKAYFTIYDNIFEGAEVTLTRQGEDEALQTLTNFKGTFTFMPPADGRTYIIDVYYAAFDKHYKSTFVSHPLPGIRTVYLHLPGWHYVDDQIVPYSYVFSYTNNSTNYTIPFNGDLIGYIYVEDADAFTLKRDGVDFQARISFPDEFQAIVYNITPELKIDKQLYSQSEAASGSADMYYLIPLNWNYKDATAHWRQVTLNWDNITSNTTLITLVDSKGLPVTNATLNYACVDKDMANPTSMGSVGYSSSNEGYQIETDPKQYAELIEVNLPGRNYPMLAKMNLWNYGYSYGVNRGKVRRHTIVLQENDEEVSDAALETLTLTGRYGRYTQYEGAIRAENTPTNLLTIEKNDTLKYSETADYPTVRKLFSDERFGPFSSRAPFSFARLTFNLHSDNIQNTDDIKLVNSDGSIQLTPDDTYTRFIGKDVFTTFSTNHCLLDFDLREKIAEGATEKLMLVKNGNETLMELPSLHNNSVDMLAITQQTKFDGELSGYDLTKVDDNINAQTLDNGKKMDMGKIGKGFDRFGSFNFSTPPTLPFQMYVERKDDYFLVRGILEANFIPYGQYADLMDAAEYAQWFSDQFRECMNAVNNMKNEAEDRVYEMKKMPGAFLGVKGYLSGIGYYNPKTNKLDINFYDGGVIMEASTHLNYRIGYNIADFGISVDVGVFSTLGFLNRSAAQGNVDDKAKIDMISESRFNLSIGGWAEFGFDAYIAKAAVGVTGSAGIDIRSGTVTPTYQKEAYAGSRVSFDFNLTGYVTARFLKWGGTKSRTLLSGSKSFYSPNNSMNPYHPDFKLGEPIFSGPNNVPRNYKKLSRRTRRALTGTSLLDNVSGMSQPTYLMGGQSLLFNNLKTVSDNNDDRLQVFSGGSKSDFVDTGVEAPMYDFAEDHGGKTELVAFEQLSDKIDATLESSDDFSQQKIVSEMSDIHVAWRTDGGDWRTQTIGSMDGSACVMPAVAVSKEDMYDTHAAVIWQQGKAKFNDDGVRYIDGSLMLSRFNGSWWSDPVEIMRINSRNMPVEYKMTIQNARGSNDEVLVAMTLKQDANNPTECTKLVYLNVSADIFDRYKVQTRYTNEEARMIQMERVIDPNSQQTIDAGESYHFTDGTNLVAYMATTDNGRDMRLTAVDMKGEPTGKLNGNVGMMGRIVNDYRMVVDDNARDLSGVALLWSQSDEETTDNGDGTATVKFKNRIYASKLCSEDQQIYFSSPIAVADIPSVDENMVLASMDGYLDGLDMKVAYSAANYSDAASVREVTLDFNNDIEHTANFNPYDVNSSDQVPVTITVENKGYEPIDRIDVTMNGNTTSYDVRVMPMGKTDLTVLYKVDDNFDGTISYDVAANFTPANSNALKIRRRGAASKAPRRVISQSGTQLNVRQVDMALKVLSKKTIGDETTIVAEVNNASLLPLANGMSVKVGLYNSPIVDNAVSFAEVTVNAADLYDATAKQNKVKLVTLTVDKPDFDQTFYLCSTPVQGSETVKDVQPLNNVLPVKLVGKYLLGDANGDGKVDIADVTAIINHINDATPVNFQPKPANVNKDEIINIGDVTGVINMINK